MAGPREALSSRPAPTSQPAAGARDPEAVVRDFIGAERLLEPSQRVLVAFSGGADSTALALLLSALGYGVVLGHVDHGMRPGSAQDGAHCRAVAGGLGLPIGAIRLPVAPAGEAAARQARYQALDRLARDAGAPAIATGHTLDDDAETVLLRRARGGFPLGIPPRRGSIVRPLLRLRRRETAAICAERGVPVAWDPSNADLSIARNRLRHRVLPAIGDAGILALAAEATRSRALADCQAATLTALLPTLARRDGEGFHLDRRALAAVEVAVQRGLLRQVLAELGIEASARLVEDLRTKVLAASGGPIDLPGGLVACSDAREMFVGRPAPAVPMPPVVLAVPGCTPVPGWGLHAHVSLGGPGVPADWRTGAWEALLDARAASGPLALRSRRPGDRYRPLGAPGERKLQDLLVDLKVPRADRDRVPVLTCGDRVAWVAGHRVDERFKLTGHTVLALRMCLRPVPDPVGVVALAVRGSHA